MKPLSREILLKVGKCCGNGCLNCPYYPKHQKGSSFLNKSEVPYLKDRNPNIKKR